MIGHKDATPAKGYTATPNVVLVGIDRDDFDLNATIIGRLQPHMKEALGELCDYFVNHCETILQGWKMVYGPEVMKHAPGEYELVISEPPVDWLIPFRPKRGDDFRVSG
jgi:hypothetical protein